MIETITSHNLPGEFSSAPEVAGMFKMEVKNFFHETGPDKTRWVTENAVHPQSLLMKGMSFFMPKCAEKESLKMMKVFKNFAETGADIRKTWN